MIIKHTANENKEHHKLYLVAFYNKYWTIQIFLRLIWIYSLWHTDQRSLYVFCTILLCRTLKQTNPKDECFCYAKQAGKHNAYNFFPFFKHPFLLQPLIFTCIVVLLSWFRCFNFGRYIFPPGPFSFRHFRNKKALNISESINIQINSLQVGINNYYLHFILKLGACVSSFTKMLSLFYCSTD